MPISARCSETISTKAFSVNSAPAESPNARSRTSSASAAAKATRSRSSAKRASLRQRVEHGRLDGEGHAGRQLDRITAVPYPGPEPGARQPGKDASDVEQLEPVAAIGAHIEIVMGGQ